MKKRLILVSLLILILLVGCESIYLNEDSNYLKKDSSKELNKISDEDLAKNINCQEKAKELIPKFLFLEDTKLAKDNLFKDGVSLEIGSKPDSLLGCLDDMYSSFRSGSEKGENVNYLYFSPPGGCNNYVSYSKQIISEEGIVLGTREFGFAPTLRIYKGNIKYETNFDEDSKILTFKWSGFDETVKEGLWVNEINFKIIDSSLLGTSIVCDETFSEESGVFKCDISGIESWTEPWDKFKIEPGIFSEGMYEIAEYNFAYCNWVE